jgi:hypothetical protein
MSCTYVLTQDERLYVQVETTWGVVPNTAGVASVAGSNCCRAISLELNPNRTVLTRQDKTGTRSMPPGSPGREDGSWKAKMSLAGNGTGGIKPDMDPFLQSIFGQAPTTVASTSVSYALSDNIPSLSIWSFRTDTAGTGNPNQRVSVGSVATSATFNLGEDIATVEFDGASKLILGSFDYTSRSTAGDTAGLSGLSAFPVQPTSPVTNGSAVQGFYGALTMDSQVLTTIRSGSLKIETGNKNSKVFGTPYPGCPYGGIRKISFQCDLYDGSDTATKDIYQRAYDKNPITVIMQVGTATGNTWTFTISGLQLAPYSYDESDLAYALKFGDSMASSTAGLTEIGLSIT